MRKGERNKYKQYKQLKRNRMEREKMRTERILKENIRRVKAQERIEREYDPLTGHGSQTERAKVMMWGKTELYLPVGMLGDKRFNRGIPQAKLNELRLSYDFEYWCVMCVKVRHKLTGELIPLRLNGPQRKVTASLERMRQSGKPIRMILLKARQWGGSTLVQMYFAWIQIMIKKGWNSLICAHVKDTAAEIRDMYAEMLDNYPPELWKQKACAKLKNCKGSTGTLKLDGRQCKISIGSSMAPDSLRGHNPAMAHLSEVAYWINSQRRKPLTFLRTVCGAIANEPMTAIVLESTANGVGNYFHQAWQAAERGESAFEPMFVGWQEIEIYRSPCSEAEQRLIAGSMSEYERRLWDKGVTLEQLKWYRAKSAEYSDAASMKAEFPSSSGEAFLTTGRGVFGHEAVDRLRRGCVTEGRRCTISGREMTGAGSLSDIKVRPDEEGRLTVWKEPKGAGEGNYVVSVDIGGRSSGSDWSVIAVIDRSGEGGKPEIVAQWRGHADHDIVAWQSAQIAKWYDMGLLVIESNTLECEEGPDASQYILSTLRLSYQNMYVRASLDRTHWGVESRPGFHTNRRSKQAAVTCLIAAVRDGGYIERDSGACDELMTYEERDNGSYGAKDGYHDDILMTRAIGLYVISEQDGSLPGGGCISDVPWW